MTIAELGGLTSLTPSVVTSMDRRTEPRINLNYFAFVRWGYGPQIDCEVTNLSACGARIMLKSEADLPENISLHILATNAHFRAIVRWRDAQELGVEFVHI